MHPHSPKAALPFVLEAAAFVVVLWGLSAAREFFVPLCLAALLSFSMAPAVRALRRRHFPEWLSVICAALIVLVPLGLGLYLAVAEIESLVANTPKIIASLKEAMIHARDSSWATHLNLRFYFEPHRFSEKFEAMVGSSAKLFLDGMLTVFSAGTTFLLIIAFSIMMLASRVHLRRSADYAFSVYADKKSAAVLDDITELIEAFLLARFGITAVSSAACWIILVLTGAPYAFLLALYYGLMTWVPVIGVFVGLGPILVVQIALGQSGGEIVVSQILLLLVWIIQDHILQPKWLGGRLKLNFFATYLALFLGELLWGPWGMFLSVPLLGVLRIIFEANQGLRPIAFAVSEQETPGK